MLNRHQHEQEVLYENNWTITDISINNPFQTLGVGPLEMAA